MSHVNSKRALLALLLAGGAAAVSALLSFGSSDEARVLAVLHELCAALSEQPGDTHSARRRRLLRALRERTIPDVTVVLSETGALEGRESILLWLSAAHGLRADLRIEQASVAFPSPDNARVTLLATLRLRFLEEERKDEREARAELRQGDGEWRLARLEVRDRLRESPEARP